MVYKDLAVRPDSQELQVFQDFKVVRALKASQDNPDFKAFQDQQDH